MEKIKSDIAKRIRLRRQVEEWYPIISKINLRVTCGGCGKKIKFIYMLRCFYCGFFFCRSCAKKHLK